MPLPEPIPGLVVRYSYLWHDEGLSGQEEGAKNRPCALVLVSQKDDKTRVLVTPITHTKPDDLSLAVEIPIKTKKRLGLDDKPAWVICSEVNEFYWPGHDLMPISKKGLKRFYYGVLPPKLFNRIKLKVQFIAKGRQLKTVERSE